MSVALATTPTTTPFGLKEHPPSTPADAMIHDNHQQKKNLNEEEKEERQKSQQATQRHLEQLLADSALPTSEEKVPNFDPSEIELSTELGCGEFGVVCLVKAIELRKDSSTVLVHPSTVVVRETSNRSVLSALDFSTSPGHTTDSDHVPPLPPATSPMSQSRKGLSSLRPSARGLLTRKHSRRAPLELIVSGAEFTADLTDWNDDDDDLNADDDLLCTNSPGIPPPTILHRQTSTPATRECLCQSVVREGTIHRYAVKSVLPQLATATKRRLAIQDLAAEACFLQALPHSNIVRLRATVGTPGTADYGLLLDRLLGTLENRMDEWRQEYYGNVPGATPYQHRRTWWQKLTGSCTSQTSAALPLLDPKVEEEFHVTRLLVCLDVARALAHLHRHNVLYRDLKPANMGFNVRGDVQIFDFGLAKELKQKDMVDTDTYLATGLTGSRRYMAPEVVLCEPYGKAVDVYSYALVVWQVFCLEKPFLKYQSMADFTRGVLEKQQRPSLRQLGPYVPDAVRELLRTGWAHAAAERPTFDHICRVLQRQGSTVRTLSQELVASDRTSFLRQNSWRSFAVRRGDQELPDTSSNSNSNAPLPHRWSASQEGSSRRRWSRGSSHRRRSSQETNSSRRSSSQRDDTSRHPSTREAWHHSLGKSVRETTIEE